MTPILIHIGYLKTGTIWLQEMLFGNPATPFQWLDKRRSTHPVHRLIRVRPLDFDAADVRKAFQPLLDEAKAADLVPVVSTGRLSGHTFSGGYDSKEIATRLKQVFPEARILIVIREQRRMIVSSYKQYVSAGGVCTLEHFLRPTGVKNSRAPAFDFRHLEYDRLITYYRSLFGPDAVLVLPFEQFLQDGRSFVAAIAQFAGRPLPQEVLDQLPYTERSNEASSALAVTISRPLNRFGRRNDVNPAPLGQSALIFNLTKRLRAAPLSTSPATRALAARSEQRMRKAVRKMVGDRYVVSNRATAELIGVDLAAYGWML